ncbi:hypothetical protein WHR41_09575 [Cladosporium halotolerans]|uniref:Acyltransferase 3 domain-containing protein n=1 Tax=Cladosporium halotolerans TaxID=1052096 RepID=A0AB34KCT3_9PEZI
MTDEELESIAEKGNTFAETTAPKRLFVALRHASRFLHATLLALRPGFMKRLSVKHAKLRPTAYLDGIRGFAALLVYILHHELWSHDAQKADFKLENAWGYQGDYYVAAMPGIRNFFTGGHYAVSTFFVLSGYVLSTQPLALMNAGEYTKLGDKLASALFRRWLRLYLPIIVTTFMTLSLWHVFGILADFIPEPTYSAGIWKWYVDVKNFTFVFRTGGEPWLSYNAHTWSIPVEMKGSLLIYTTCNALSRCTQRARLLCQAVLIFYLLYIADGAHYAMFMTGMLLSDIDHIVASGSLPAWIMRMERLKSPFFHSLFLVSFYLGGAPSFDSDIQVLRDSPGWHTLSIFKPQAVFDYKWFYLFFASAFLVVSVPRISWLRRFFESCFCQYLGRISYMFYLIHGPILWTLGDRIYAAVGFSRESHAMRIPKWSNRLPIPAIGPFAMELNFFAAQCLLLPATLWVAEVATTLIDDNGIAFCVWLYRRMTGKRTQLSG